MTEGVRVPPIELVADTRADPDTAWRTLTEPARDNYAAYWAGYLENLRDVLEEA